MTPTELAILSLHTYIGFVFLWLLLFHFRPRYCQARFRQDMFELRDELYDFAASGEVPFSDKAYGLLRTRMNGMIRFAHQVSFFHSLLAMGLFRLRGDREAPLWYLQDLEEAISSVSNESAKQRLREFHARMLMLVIKHMIRSSILLLTTLGVIIALAFFVGFTKKVLDRLLAFPGLSYIEAEAQEVGAI